MGWATRGLAAIVAVVLVHASGGFAAVGDITTFTDPAGNVSQPEDITSGPDGNLWFTSLNNARIGRIATTGPLPPAPTPAQPVAAPPRFTG
jgi:streptogramin lyase